MMARGNIKILLADDHPLIHAGIEWALQNSKDLLLVAKCYNYADVLPAVERFEPQLAIVDLRLPDGDGLDLIRHLSTRERPVSALAFSAFEEAIYAERVLRAGGRGYLEKSSEIETLLLAVRTVAEGRVFLSEPMHQRLATMMMGNRPPQDPISTLSDRELQVFQLIGMGKSTRQIAGHLSRSVKTIETYRDRLRKKLGLNSGTELTHVAIERATRHR